MNDQKNLEKYRKYVGSMLDHYSDILTKVMFGDFQVRASSEKNDEFSFFTLYLNILIASLHRKDTEVTEKNEELRKHREHLEELVEERTAELKTEIDVRKRVEGVLRESEERFRQVAESAGEWIWEGNADGLYVYTSPVVDQILGYKPEEIVGKKHFYDFFTPDVREEQKKAAFKVFARKEALTNFPSTNLHKNGNTVVLETSGMPILDERGNLLGYRGVDTDVTECKRMERKLEQTVAELKLSNAELEQFAYVASHDLQEPLRMVRSYLQLLERRYKYQLDENANEFIDYAVDGATRMQGLINDLLTYSRVGTRGKPFEPTDVETVLKHATDNLKVAIEESGAVVAHEPLPEVMADGGQMVQLMQNLIGNGIKFKGPDAPRISVSAARKGDELLFSIVDNEIGVDPKNRDKIFQVFQRLHTREEYPGTGIGLVVCKKIVERHGGRIWVESEVGHGSTFYFTIPYQGGQRI